MNTLSTYHRKILIAMERWDTDNPGKWIDLQALSKLCEIRSLLRLEDLCYELAVTHRLFQRCDLRDNWADYDQLSYRFRPGIVAGGNGIYVIEAN